MFKRSQILAIFASLCLSISLSWAAEPTRLFNFQALKQAQSETGITLPVPVDTGKHPIALDTSVFELPIGSEITLDLPDQRSYNVKLDRKKLHKSGSQTWTGFLTNEGKQYRVTLTQKGDALMGQVLTPEGLFKVTRENGQLLLIDTKQAGYQSDKGLYEDALMKDEPGAENAQPVSVHQDEHQHEHLDELPVAETANATTGSTQLDILVLYNQSFANANPGDQLQARLDHLVAVSNQAFLDSQVDLNLRIVHSAEVNYSNTTTNSTLLNDLSNGNGVFSNVKSLRDQYGADLVTILRPYNRSSHSGCGIAWIYANQSLNWAKENLAYSVVSDGNDGSYYCEDLTLVHEIGHNLGSLHDRGNAGSSKGAYNYSYGHGFSGNFGTIMSYIKPSVGVFSNPSISAPCNGSACGVSESASNAAHNALSINNTKATIASYRESTTTTPPTTPPPTTPPTTPPSTETDPIAINQSSVTLIAGASFAFSANDVSTTTPSWSQTTAATGSLSAAANGLSATYTAKAAGSDRVTVSGTVNGSSGSSSATVKVNDAVTTNLTSTTGMAVGSTLQLLAFGGDGSYAYSTSNSRVATVNSSGVVSAVAAGVITVTVDDQASYNGSKTRNTATTANIEVVKALSVTSSSTVNLDTQSASTAQISATGGKTEGAYTYSSRNTGVVKVSASGALTAVGAGTTTVEIKDATYPNIAASITVKVNTPLTVSSGGSTLSGTQTVAQGGSLTFTPSGGTGSYSVTASSGQLVQSGDSWTYTAPSTGAFAGTHTITVKDTTSGQTSDIKVSVPLTIKLSKVNIPTNDTSQTVTISGGSTADTYKIDILNGNGLVTTALFDNDFSSRVADGVAPDTKTNGADNVVSVKLNPADNIDTVTAFRVRATSSNQALAAASSESGRLIPVVNYAGTVVNELDSPIGGATVELLTEVEGPTSVVTQSDGAFGFVLPDTGAVYQFSISAPGYQKRQVTSTTIGVTGDARVALEAEPSTGTGTYTISGTVTLSGGSDRTGVKVQVYDGTTFSEELKLGTDGKFAFYLSSTQFADPSGVAYKLYASMEGYENGSATDTNNDGVINLRLSAKPSTTVNSTTLRRSILGDGVVLDSERFDLSDFEIGLSRKLNFDSDGDNAVDFKLNVEVSPSGVRNPGSNVHLVLDAAENKGATSHYTSGSDYLFDVSLQDSVGGNDISDDDIKRIIITLPFDVTAIEPGSLEAGTRSIFHADTVSGLNSGQGTRVPPADIHFVDYINGLVTFETGSLSVFGVGSSTPVGPGDGGTTNLGGGGGGGGCFIATAAFGSYQDQYVKVLRDFRDQQLLSNEPGQWFVKQYYTYSPAFADWLREHELARSTVRLMLWPLIGAAMLLKAPLTIQLALFAGVMAMIALIRRRRRDRQLAAVRA